MTCMRFLDTFGNPLSHFGAKTLSVWHPLPRDLKRIFMKFLWIIIDKQQVIQPFLKIQVLKHYFSNNVPVADPRRLLGVGNHILDQNRFGAYFCALKRKSKLTFSSMENAKSLNHYQNTLRFDGISWNSMIFLNLRVKSLLGAAARE